ncbi:glycosyltransferase family 4 protein [Marivirga sp.]|uniref:glycosyltransferase family 4 protein n=1 Tax=Marivirga sp. TaxID=2018662 RepID=UPI002D7FB05F|nr:glycosyltransferase family 4 protein [Marivirga sp.]HET8860559.1 glycosyltransferase family 4 protein [Marivirga sp.]
MIYSKRIVFLIDTLETGGAEKSLLAITSRFKKYEPIFIQLFEGDTLKSQFEENGIRVISLNLKPDYNFKLTAQKVQVAIQSYDIDLIHSTLFRSDQVARYLVKHLNVPLVNSLVNNSYAKVRYNKMSFIQRLKLKCIEFFDRQSLSKVDLFISNSHAIKRSNAKALKIPENNIKVIFRGRELDAFNQNDDTDTIKKELVISNEKVFLNVSRLLDRKGQLDLIDAFHQYSKLDENSILLIAGEGQYRTILEQRIDELGLNSKVKLLGSRNDIPELLQLADYFVFPSHYEGLPGALIEAMMSKTPIIASDIPENLECVNNENSLIFPVGNVDALTNKMIEAQEIDWSKKIEKAYQFASENFDINKIAEEYERTYNELLENRNSPRL